MKYLVKFDCEIDGCDGPYQKDIFEEYDSEKDLIKGICSFESANYNVSKVSGWKYYCPLQFMDDHPIHELIKQGLEIYLYSDRYFNEVIKESKIALASLESELSKNIEYFNNKGIYEKINNIDGLKSHITNLIKQKEEWLTKKQQFEKELENV